MRPWPGPLLAAAAVATAPCAGAQTTAASATSPAPNSALFKAAFSDGDHARDQGSGYSLSELGLRSDADATPATEAPFSLPSYTGTSLDQLRLSSAPHPADNGVALWSSNEVTLGSGAGGVDTLRVSMGSVARAHGGVVSARPDGFSDPDPEAYDVRYIHGWPSALKWSAAGYDLDVSPHAGLGMTNGGGTAEAGAMVRFGQNMGRQVANKLGLHEVSGSSFDKGRWFLFAAASGQAVGWNMTGGVAGAPRNSWSMESTSALISDAQAGVGWRKGAMQASFG
ncbi:MAG TPA: lipid A-modifier LpxR family protein, partial [Caulobacteraceae bacterium]|nr:lipid A-modifier LpxR family protein [Caulobacteraceae bacterium]